MSIYPIIGILRCPYLNKCGPKVREFDFGYERDSFWKVCYTREHFSCPDFMSKEKTKSRAPISKNIEEKMISVE